MKLPALLLGAASIVAAGAPAHAADLAMAEPADQYARVCNAFGAGFFYIPGTDTCLGINGYVRTEAHYVDGDIEVLFGGAPSDFNNFTTRSRGVVRFDARTATDLGLIRSYIEFQATIGPDDFGDSYDGTDFELPAAFIEVSNDFGTFTAGHTGSFFDFYGSDDYGTRIDIDDNTTEQNLFAYTLIGPGGLRGTISVEDPKSGGRRLDGADDYEGQDLPDLVGSVRIDKEWGAAQLMGVVRDIEDEDGDGVGFAVGGGVSLNLPVAGLVAAAQVGYSEGALAYITTDPGGIGDFAGPTGEDTNTAWMARAGLTGPLTEQVSAWLDGSFTRAEDEVNDDDYDFWAFVVGVAWSPNDNFLMGPEFGYNNIDGDDDGEDGDAWGLMWRFEASY